MESNETRGISFDNLFEIALDVERRAGEFYLEASVRTVEPLARKLFLTLAETERLHSQVLYSRRKEAQRLLGPESKDVSNSKAVSYLKGWARELEFNRAQLDRFVDNHIVGILEEAALAEDRLAAFYEQIQLLVPQNTDFNWLAELVSDEHSHARMLRNGILKLRARGIGG